MIVVHLYGQMPDMDALSRTADKAGILLLEDAAQAHGATWHGRPAGSIRVRTHDDLHAARDSPSTADSRR